MSWPSRRCSCSPAAAQIKIGFQAPLTGPAATDGVSAKVAAELAIDRINAAGGILGQKIELVTYDDQAKTEEAVFTANKLVGAGRREIRGLRQLFGIGPCGGADLPGGQGAVHLRLRRASRHHPRRRLLSSAPFTSASRRDAPRRKFIGEISAIKDDFHHLDGQRLRPGDARRLQERGRRSSASRSLGEYTLPASGPAVRLDRGQREARQSRRPIYITGYFFTAAPLVSQLRAAGITRADHRIAGVRRRRS